MMSMGKRISSLTFRRYVWSRPSACGFPFFGNRTCFNQSCKDLVNGDKVETTTVRVRPQEVLPQSKDIESAIDLVGKISPQEVRKVVQQFLSWGELKDVISSHGMDDNMFYIVKDSFERYCRKISNLPEDLYIILGDIINGKRNVLDILPYFKSHIFHVYPHLQYMDELQNVGNLQNPAEWYPAARAKKRKWIFHCGPTNSGKTHHALKRFMEAKSAIYCAPLKLLASEIFHKTNKNGMPCDLITGDDRRYAVSVDEPAEHISCTVEMANFTRSFDVAVIDEVQMIRCQERGYAWTMAILGLCASELHLCGEISALNYLMGLAERTGDKIECIKYERLTKLTVEDKALTDLKNVQEGDCIVCFNKSSIFMICSALYNLSIKFAIVYGSLPPSIKRKEADTFNNMKNGCRVLVATDAIGMGLNLNIRRVIFFSIIKNQELISTSLALQIAGRAGRYKSAFEEGFVTTYNPKHLPMLKKLLSQSSEEITQAGLFPTEEQDVFISLAKVNEFFFICDICQMKELSYLIQHMDMSIAHKYLFCTAPVNMESKKALVFFTQFSKLFSMGKNITASFIKKNLKLPKTSVSTVSGLEDLEVSYDCLELYLWFGTRLPSSFPDRKEVEELLVSVEKIIYTTMGNIFREKAKGPRTKVLRDLKLKHLKTNENGKISTGTDESGKISTGTDENGKISTGTDESGKISRGTDENGNKKGEIF